MSFCDQAMPREIWSMSPAYDKALSFRLENTAELIAAALLGSIDGAEAGAAVSKLNAPGERYDGSPSLGVMSKLPNVVAFIPVGSIRSVTSFPSTRYRFISPASYPAGSWLIQVPVA